MTAFGVTPKEQVTFLLGRHDPNGIFAGNPDAPPDEYEGEAEEILHRLSTVPLSENQVRSVVRAVFVEMAHDEGDDEVDEEAIHNAAHDIYLVLKAHT